MKSRFCLTYLVLVCLLISCTDDEPYPQKPVINMTLHGSHDRFAGMPVYIRVWDADNNLVKGDYSWDLGNGFIDGEQQIKHTFETEGDYLIKVNITLPNGRTLAREATFTVLPKLKTFGLAEDADNGLAILQNDAGNYVVLTGPYGFLPAPTEELYTISETYSLISKKPFEYAHETHLITAIPPDRFAFIDVIGSTFKVYDDAGDNIFSTSIPTMITPRQILPASDGYYLIGDSIATNGYASMNFRNLQGETVWFRSTPNLGASYAYTNWAKSPDTFIRYHYPETPNVENPETPKIIVQSTSSEILNETQTFITSPDGFIPLNVGFLVYGEQESIGEFVDRYERFDEAGNFMWGFGGYGSYRPCCGEPLSYSGTSAFEKNGFTYMFYRNMAGVKISNTGEVVWFKRFTLQNDIFRAATINAVGNFVLLGNHNIQDYQASAYPQLYDLVLVEVNADGEIVN